MARLIAFLALPLSLLLLLPCTHAGWVQETWSITSLTTHFMSANSGLPDGTWPRDSGFPTTATFTLRQSFRRGPAVGGLFRESAMVLSNDVHCGATWMPSRVGRVVLGAGEMPGEWIECEEGRNGSLGLGFRFGEGGGRGRGPMGFELVVGRGGGTGEDWIVPYASGADIPDISNVTEPLGWLICAGGEPLSGVRCQLEGQVTRYGYTMLKPSIVVSNQTSDVESFDRR